MFKIKMTYSEEEIQKYLNILHSFNGNYNNTVFYDTIRLKKPEKVSCYNCGNTHFIEDDGLSYCNKCFYSIGHILGYNEITEKDRCCPRQKSIYKRDYHYQNKIEEINEKFNLEMTSDEKFDLLLKLQQIDKVMKKINEKWKRKRSINITYLIKRLLIMNFYDEWYDDFKNMNKIEEINKKFNLEMTSDEKFDLLLKLQEIDKVMKTINEKWKRKRLINITYLIKKILSEYDNSKAKKIKLHLSEKMLNFYDEWYDDFKKIES